MFKLNVVRDCPFTRGYRGVVYMPHSIIAELAGGVTKEDIEWLCLLHGEHSEDRLEVWVKSIEVPPQYRSAIICGLLDNVKLDSDVVGVVHSHHSMLAMFSYTDNTTFNTRFPLSIVIARPNQFFPATHITALGFDYKAEGRAHLPCNSLGVVPYAIVPDPVPADLQLGTTSASRQPDKGPLGDCSKPQVESLVEGRTVFRAPCGEEGSIQQFAMFGVTGTTLLDQLKKVSVIQKEQYGTSTPLSIRPAGVNRGRWRRIKQQYRDEMTLLDYDAQAALTNDLTEDLTTYTRTRLCITCACTKLDYTAGDFVSFPTQFIDGTGVCHQCAIKM